MKEAGIKDREIDRGQCSWSAEVRKVDRGKLGKVDKV